MYVLLKVILDVGVITCLLSIHYRKSYIASINCCQRQYTVLRSYIRHIKQQHIAFWDTHWNLSKETTHSNGIHNNSSAETIPAVDFHPSPQSSLDEYSDETFDELEEGTNREIVTDALSFEDLVLIFLLELRPQSINCLVRVSFAI